MLEFAIHNFRKCGGSLHFAKETIPIIEGLLTDTEIDEALFLVVFLKFFARR